MSSERYDVVVVGGGTAGAVIAARLSADPARRVALLEWGPNDATDPRALEIRRWFELLESEYDLDYRSVPQARGNSHVRQARARILGGCSSHNTMIAFRPPDSDYEEWVTCGATGWDASTMRRYYRRLQTPIVRVAPEHRNPYLEDVIHSAAAALKIPIRDGWNDKPFADGAGFLEIGYDPRTGIRSSSSVAYLHDIAGKRPNLDVRLEHRALRILVDDEPRATAVEVRRGDGSVTLIAADREIVLCCGAIDTPRLLLLSGIGPPDHLRSLGIDVVADAPGVGENLMDHPEGLVLWEAAVPIPTISATDWDIAVMYRVDPASRVPEILAHVPLMTYPVHSERLGYETPEHSVSMTPNVTRPRSRGRVWLGSPDPDEPPLIDYGYFTDPEGYDERILVAGIQMARNVASVEPMSRWIRREVFPGPAVTAEEELSELGRATNHTVYHVSCTCRIGPADDALSVLDDELRVRKVRGLSVADASSFPVLTTVNPVVAVLTLAERAADLIATRA